MPRYTSNRTWPRPISIALTPLLSHQVSQGPLRNRQLRISQRRRLKPDYDKAYRVRGNFYQFLGQADKERADYDSAIRVAPNSAAAYVERAVFFSSHDEHARAIADYDAAIRLDPGDAFIYLLRGHGYESLGRREQAIADYRKALSAIAVRTQARKVRSLAAWSL
jgi:tetratricopeptide (TPR) repeat protein